MEGGSMVLGYCCSGSPNFQFNLHNSNDNKLFIPLCARQQTLGSSSSYRKRIIQSQLSLSGAAGNRNLTLMPTGKNDDHGHGHTYTVPLVDKSGKFCSPRAARELALLIVYASCLEGSDPVRLFEKRLNVPKELYCEFDMSSLLQYDHMSFGGPPITTTTLEEAHQLLTQFEAQSDTEAAVLSAPLKLVYSKLLLRFTKKLLGAVVDRWDDHVVMIDKVAPINWKSDPIGRILELSILHLAMSEISGLGTRHQIVINEAVDLAKRFCDGTAPRIINGCLRTFVEDSIPS